MKNICPICSEYKKLKWLGYIQQDICKSCNSDINMEVVNETLSVIINNTVEAQKRYTGNFIYCIGDILEELIKNDEITSTQYLSVSNFLIKEGIIYECYLSFKQFSFTQETINLGKEEIIKKLNSLIL